MADPKASLKGMTPADIEKIAQSMFTVGSEPITADTESREKLMENAVAVRAMIVGNLGWKVLSERIANQVEYLQGKLMTCDNIGEINGIRGQLVGLQTLKVIAREIITQGQNAAIELANTPEFEEDDDHL